MTHPFHPWSGRVFELVRLVETRADAELEARISYSAIPGGDQPTIPGADWEHIGPARWAGRDDRNNNEEAAR